MISPIASATSADRPACDIDRRGDFPSRARCRCSGCRARSSARDVVKSASRRALSCRARRSSRHCLPQVICVLAVDGAGMYQRRHSQQRRRHLLPVACFIPRRSPRDTCDATSPPPSLRRSTPQGGSLRRRRVDLSQAAAKGVRQGRKFRSQRRTRFSILLSRLRPRRVGGCRRFRSGHALRPPVSPRSAALRGDMVRWRHA